ncbi:hypothetical protein PMAC_002919 [Pneumocystis sp. 'macacae']|nr:hypothetical protein PMAC_002919 [Pneumocystis sp. 'macacae']
MYMRLKEKTHGKLLEEDTVHLNKPSTLNSSIKLSANTILDDEIKPEIPIQMSRLRPGTKKEDIPITPIVPLDFSGQFSLEMYLSGLIGCETLHPISLRRAKEMAEAPPGVDPWIWVYELVRKLTIDLNVLVVGMLEDSCSPKKCPEMRANEWQYLCACHNPPQECAAIDYIIHTLDNATTLLCSSKYFPSKMSIPVSSTRHFSSIMRRLYRIFSHAWYKHYDIFWKNEISLYRRFMAVSQHYHFKYEHSAMVDEVYSKEVKCNNDDTNKEHTTDNDNQHPDNYNSYETPTRFYNYDNKDNHDNKENIKNMNTLLPV